tara:strand:- start:7351 stop:7641 length:291 start_codon:yes stop_codon:yes gene_type:complete
MKKLKLILPMMAFIFVIALSFAFVNTTADDYYATGFIKIDSTWYPVDVDCSQNEQYDCLAQIEGEPETYDVHNGPSETAPVLKSASPTPKVIDDPR